MPHRESEQVENKQSLKEWHKVVETVAAFATAKGGVIRVGIAPTGERRGVQVGQATLEQLANQIKENTDPPQYPSIVMEGGEDSAILAISVPESPVKPVWAFGRPFKRVGRTNQRLAREETQRLVEITTGRTWDALPCPELTIEDLDRMTMESFLRKAGQDVGVTTEAVLHNLKLVTHNQYCNAAALLFARCPSQFVSQAQVKCGRFRGVTSVDFLDQQTFEDNVLRQLEQALAFVSRNTRQGIRITGKPEREVLPEYPEEAVREAVLNAICHRDYAMPGNVQVRIYDDRLEVWNPGKLPNDLTVEMLYREHESRPRNPRLADAFYRARLIEQWGTGTLRIVRACEVAGLPRPDFSCEKGTFIVRFGKPTVSAETLATCTLNERQLQVMDYVRKHGEVTTRNYRQVVGISRRQAYRDLETLLDRGLLVRRGVGRGIRYVLPEAKEQNNN